MSRILEPSEEQAALDLPQMVDPEEIEPDQDWEASAPFRSIVSEAILSDIKPEIQRSRKWRILVYGINQPGQDEANDHHLSLLSGIIGEQISLDQKLLPNFSFEKNGMTTMIHVGSHTHCSVSYEDVDLLLYFTRANKENLVYNHIQMEADFKKISQSRGALIWKHSVIVLTGVDMIMDDYKKETGSASTKLQTLLKIQRGHIKQYLSKAIGDEADVSPGDAQVQPAGRQEEPDLPAPLDKWFSKLWYECFHASKVKAMPAILKLAMKRIMNHVTSKKLQQYQFYLQPIEAKHEPRLWLIHVWRYVSVLGSKVIQTVRKKQVALAIAVIIFSLLLVLVNPYILLYVVVAVGIVTAVVVVVGNVAAVVVRAVGIVTAVVVAVGKVAAVVVRAVGIVTVIQLYRTGQTTTSNQQDKIKTTELKQFYTELLTLIPYMRGYLTQWAKGQTVCNIVVAGIEGEGVSTVAAALTGQEPTDGTWHYKQHIARTDTRLVVYDFPGFPKKGRREDEAKKLVHFQNISGTHLLIFCIPITSLREDFAFSEHIKYLERLWEIDSDILSNTIIALTHTNELWAMRQDNELQMTFKQFFVNELEQWVKHIKTVLRKSIQEDTDVTVVPVGDSDVSIDFSEDENPTADTQYHWLSQLLLSAMPATKPEGLPALIKANRKRLEDFPDEYPQANKALECIVNAQCSLFSQTGQENKSHHGEAIGLMLGVNDKQNW